MGDVNTCILLKLYDLMCMLVPVRLCLDLPSGALLSTSYALLNLCARHTTKVIHCGVCNCCIMFWLSLQLHQTHSLSTMDWFVILYVSRAPAEKINI